MEYSYIEEAPKETRSRSRVEMINWSKIAVAFLKDQGIQLEDADKSNGYTLANELNKLSSNSKTPLPAKQKANQLLSSFHSFTS